MDIKKMSEFLLEKVKKQEQEEKLTEDRIIALESAISDLAIMLVGGDINE